MRRAKRLKPKNSAGVALLTLAIILPLVYLGFTKSIPFKPQYEIKAAFDEPMREMRDTANLLRDAADPRKIMAEAEAEQRVLDDAEAATTRMSEPTATNDWAAPAAGTADPSRNGDGPFDPLADPGYDQVATPGDPPETS